MQILRTIAILVAVAPFALAQGIPALPEGVSLKARESGLKFAELNAGDGTVRPALGDKVQVYYWGRLADGTLFDQRPEDGPPAEFVCGGLIPAWNEALQEMSPGARWRIEVPAELGYGSRGSPPKIPGGATLTFELVLVGVKSAPQMVRVDGEKVETSVNGVRYQMLVAGTGAMPASDDVMRIAYSIWDADGKLLDSTFRHDGTIDGAAGDMRLPFLKEIPLLMKVGGACVVEPTKAQSFPDGFPPPWGELRDGITVWRLELLGTFKPLPVPDFALPTEGKSTKLDNGIVYEVLREGAGEPPTALEPLRCHYAGWLTDGTLFDSSYPRAVPLEFQMRGVIPGWGEALKRMKPGAIWRVQIPPELAYGAGGSPPTIPPSATLVFQIELVEVVGRGK